MVVQKILRLQVSVSDPQVVQVRHPCQNHPEGLSGVPLGEVAPTDDTIQQLSTSGQFQHHVNPLWKLEHFNHLDHIGVLHPLQHGHLWRTHLAGLRSQELHHFYGKRLASCSVLHTYDAAEATTTDQGFDLISDTAETKALVPLLPLATVNKIKHLNLHNVRSKSVVLSMNISALPGCDTRIEPVLVPGRFNLTSSLSRRLLYVVWFWLKGVSVGGKPPASPLPWMFSWLAVIATCFAKGHKRLYDAHVSLRGNIRLHLTAATAHPSAQKPAKSKAVFFLTWQFKKVMHEVWKEPKQAPPISRWEVGSHSHVW